MLVPRSHVWGEIAGVLLLRQKGAGRFGCGVTARYSSPPFLARILLVSPCAHQMRLSTAADSSLSSVVFDDVLGASFFSVSTPAVGARGPSKHVKFREHSGATTPVSATCCCWGEAGHSFGILWSQGTYLCVGSLGPVYACAHLHVPFFPFVSLTQRARLPATLSPAEIWEEDLRKRRGSGDADHYHEKGALRRRSSFAPLCTAVFAVTVKGQR
ncbi:hypothetical protein MRX96_037840 [Rhipicephalus microplus]